MGKINYMKWGQAGIAFGFLSYLISLIYQFLFKGGIANFSFAIADVDVSNTLKSGVDSSLGTKILGLMNGIIPSGGWLFNVLAITITGIVVFVLGRLAYEYIPRLKTNNKAQKLMTVSVMGSIIVGVALSLMSGNFSVHPSLTWLWIILATAIAFFINSVIYVWLGSVKSLEKLMPVPE